MMKNLRFLLLAFLCPLFAMGQQNLTFNHNGTIRDYILYEPANRLANAPLVFVLHGYTGSAQGIMGYSEMNAQADTNGFVVCYPQGAGDNFGTPHWNAHLTISNVDDIGFLTDLAAHLQTTYNLNPDHTFSCGFSNGGFMSYTLACEKPDVFKAIASVAGTMSGRDWANCNPSHPIPIMQIHGTADGTVPYNGGMPTAGGWGGAPGIESVVQSWKARNSCASTDTVVLSARSTANFHRNGIDDNEVWFFPIQTWGHTWPSAWAASSTGVTAAKEIWDFFNLVVARSSTALDDLVDEQSIRIFPNPTSGTVTVELADDKPLPYQLFNLHGQFMAEGMTYGQEMTLDLGEYPVGLYVLQVNGRGGKVWKK